MTAGLTLLEYCYLPRSKFYPAWESNWIQLGESPMCSWLVRIVVMTESGWDCLYGLEGRVGEGMGLYWKWLLTLCQKNDYLPYLCDDLCWKIASKNKILVLLVVCDVERYDMSIQ